MSITVEQRKPATAKEIAETATWLEQAKIRHAETKEALRAAEVENVRAETDMWNASERLRSMVESVAPLPPVAVSVPEATR